MSIPLRLVLVLTAALGIPLSAVEPVMLSLSLPDAERSRERFAASLYGQVWLDPTTTRLRDHLAQLASRAGGGPNADPFALWQSLVGAELIVLPPPPGGRAPLQAQIRGAEAARDLAAICTALGLRQLAVGEAVTDGGPAAVLAGDALLLGSAGSTLHALPVPTSDHDLLLDWNRDAVMAAIRRQSEPSRQALLSLIDDLLPEGSLVASFSPRGLDQRLQLDAVPAGLAPVDRALLARLPAHALGVHAIGLDGAGWWEAHGASLLALAASRLQGADGDLLVAEQQLTGIVTGLGIRGGLPGLAAALSGTAVLVIHGDSPVPGLSLAVPRSPGLDGMVTLGLGMAGMLTPVEGQQRFLVLRGLGAHGQDLAPGLSIGRDASHWWLSSDAFFLAQHLAGESGGWDTSAMGEAVLAEAGAQASVIGAIDAQALLRSLVPVAAYTAGWLEHGRYIETIGQSMLRLARRAAIDTTVGQPLPDGGYVLETRGALGGLGSVSPAQVAMIAAIVVPELMARPTTREHAATRPTP